MYSAASIFSLACVFCCLSNSSLNISLSKLFENLGGQNTNQRSIPLECYEFLLTKSEAEQEQIIKILMEMDKYKGS
jgi:hypothetical protein